LSEAAARETHPIASVKLQIQLLEIDASELALVISVGIVRVLALAVCLGSQIHNPLCLVTIPFPPSERLNIREGLKIPDGVQACTADWCELT
jgi:hypothetical protein